MVECVGNNHLGKLCQAVCHQYQILAALLFLSKVRGAQVD